MIIYAKTKNRAFKFQDVVQSEVENFMLCIDDKYVLSEEEPEDIIITPVKCRKKQYNKIRRKNER